MNKRTVLIMVGVMLLSSLVLSAQELEQNARRIKSNYPIEYQKIFKHYAVKEWGNDYQMIAYTINLQSNSLLALINKFEPNNTEILRNAIIEWSYDGHEQYNSNKFHKLKVFDLENAVGFYVDWQMVEYVYDNQVKAKDSL